MSSQDDDRWLRQRLRAREAGVAMDEAVAKERTSTGGAYIWFHYKTQFAAQGRLHVIQMEVPVPVDASAEERERLLQEALAGLDQFSARLEQRLNQTSTPRKTPGEEGGRNGPSRPTGPREPPAEMRLSTSARPAPAPAAPAENRMSPSATQLRRRMAPALPSTPGVFGNLNSDLTLPQFLQILRDNFNIDSKYAMKLLGVRSLSNINLREALDQLRYLLAQRSAAANRTASASTSAPSGSVSASVSLSEQAYPAVFSQRELSQGRAREELIVEEESEDEEQVSREASESSLPLQEQQFEDEDSQREEQEYVFDEEDDETDQWDQENGGGYEREDAEEGEELNLEGSGRRQLSLQERIHARTLLNKMREARGGTPASQARLTVLWNVIGEQISEDELRELIGRIWGVTALKQLSIDQVEALISWAKQDNFDRDVAAILALN